MIKWTSIGIVSLAVFLSGITAFSSGRSDVEGSQPSFGEIITGFTSLYHEQPAGSGGFKQDLSGAAVGGGRIVYVDDGGKPSDFNFARVLDAFSPLPANSDDGAVNLSFSYDHKDLEGATFLGNKFLVTTSLGSSTDPAQRRLTSFKVNSAGDQLIEQSSVDLRDELMSALEVFGDANCGGQEWFDRVNTTAAKSGGLNIEGITRTNVEEDAFLWGIRSPLCDKHFGDPSIDPTLKLNKGHALIAKVENPFGGTPAIDLQMIRLKTGTVEDGIRAIEWIPALSAYVIVGGTIPAANDYSLWYWEPGQKNPSPLELEGFEQLCRPESVIQLTESNKDYLVILSEESGAPCADAPFTYVKAEILAH